MIYIDRDSVDENGVPIRPDDDWFERAADATEQAIEEGAGHEFDEALYGHAQVRAALEKLFHSKCAYCEWKPTGGSDWDVEHFRPKGRVADRNNHSGYYWLAYTWSNLYLSCIHCNRKRKDKPTWDDPKELPAAGKSDQFPLDDESTRVMSHNDNVHLLDEHTLLIDPCYDDPEEYLGFDATGQILSLEDNPYGERTIKVFHLNRRRLCIDRRTTIAEVARLVEALQKCRESDADDVADILESAIAERMLESSQFTAVARYVYHDPEVFNIPG